MVVALQIIGHKKAGKTTVMTALIRACRQLGLTVSAIKHDAHQAQMDHAGTDSDQMSKAGAAEVILTSKQGTFLHLPDQRSLTELQQWQVPADILLVEGYKQAPLPKLVLLQRQETAADWVKIDSVLAFASLTPRVDVDLCGPQAIVNWAIHHLQTALTKEETMTDPLTHFNDQERAKMVDVTAKTVTERFARAKGQIRMQPATLNRVKAGQVKKGDVLAVAQVAGIMAAKKTSELIPMCHLIPLTGVDLHFKYLDEQTIQVESQVKTKHVTGVEIEALTAVQIALLTIYDMCKAMDRGMLIHDVHLVEKAGGKSGHFIYGG